jgi:hypothetical protein
MAPYTSPFFSATTGYSGEQELINDLVIEQIAIYGMDILYMPRKNINLDKILHESSKSAFELALPIPMYVKSFDGYDQSMELLTKFGVRSSDTITLQMSRSQFTASYSPFIEQLYREQNGGADLDHLEGQTDARPKEGDLIYFPFDDSIFEIKYVEFEQPFFTLGRGYIFEIQCERFEYSGETFDTGYDDIDDTREEVDYPKIEFTLASGGDGTFTLREKVTIYDVSDVESPTTEIPDPIDPFRFYNDLGYLEGVDTVSGTVLNWDLPNLKLKVGDISNMDPEQEDRTDSATEYDVIVNKLANVLIVGEDSGASWLTTAADDARVAFTDNTELQKEFDQIKIVDPADDNPFGFN